MLARDHRSILEVHRAALDWEQEVEAALVGEGQVLLSVAGVALPEEPERDAVVDDRGRDVGDALVLVAYGLVVGRQEGVHHDVATVVLDPGEDEVAVGEAPVLGEPDARPALGVFGGDNELDGVVGGPKTPDELVGAVAFAVWRIFPYILAEIWVVLVACCL